jgi:hypothetical protein
MSPPFPFQNASMSALISTEAAMRVLLLGRCARCSIAERAASGGPAARRPRGLKSDSH